MLRTLLRVLLVPLGSAPVLDGCDYSPTSRGPGGTGGGAGVRGGGAPDSGDQMGGSGADGGRDALRDVADSDDGKDAAGGGGETDSGTAVDARPSVANPCPAPASAAWTPPIGVPVPPFGTTEVAPPVPSPWNVATPGFYYVDETHPSATDTNNSYGTPALPRRSIPRELPAGSVVDLHNTFIGPSQPYYIHSSGTAAQPVFIRGARPSAKPVVRDRFIVYGSYFVLENIFFGRLTISYPTSHAVLRNSEVSSNATGGQVGYGLGIGGVSAADSVNNVLICNNYIHHNGVWDSNAGDSDFEGIVAGAFTSHVWVVDNELAYNEGTGYSISAGRLADEASTHHMYIGRNISHHNKEGGFGLKQGQDVIYSQNTSYGHPESNSSDGSGMGHQYAPERVWYLFNHIYDCPNGITVASNSGLGSGKDTYVIGNLIHNIHSPTNFQAGSAWSYGTGIMMAGSENRYVVNNTIYDVDNGITSPASSGRLAIANNIVANVTNPRGSHVFVEHGAVASASTIHHNLFQGTARLKWGSAATAHDVSSFQAAFPAKGLNTLDADPLFVSPLSRNFHLGTSSPAIDAGLADSVYQTFYERYGFDIQKDIDGTARPVGGRFDLGALEHVGKK